MDDMILTTPEIPKIPVNDYEFRFDGGVRLELSIFPTLGDTVEETPSGFVFHIPRLQQEQRLFRPIGVTITKCMRMDPRELIKRAKDAQENRKAAEKAAYDARQG